MLIKYYHGFRLCQTAFLKGQQPTHAQSKTRPATAAALLSLVVVFLSALPAWISPRNPAGLPPAGVAAGALEELAAGGGGGGGGGALGAPVGGIGGGGGGAPGAPIDGIGGGGGGGAGGADVISGAGDGVEGTVGAAAAGTGGGPGGAGGGDATVGGDATAVGEETDLLSAADRGRGGPMVPNSMDASWAALVPPGLSSSESSSSSSLSEPQPSSVSARFRDIGAGAAVCGAVMRWNGLVDASGAAGGGAGAGASC